MLLPLEDFEVRRNNEKKLVSILFVSILLVAVLPMTVGSQEPFRIIYVGGSGHGNYSDINTALTYAPDAATLLIYPGIYRETLVLDFPITLTAASSEQDSVIINGQQSGTVVTINSEKVNLQGLTISESGSNWMEDFGVKILGENASITNCHFTEMSCGLYIDSPGNTVINNLFSSTGILVNNTEEQTIRSNTHDGKEILYLDSTADFTLNYPKLAQLIINNCTNVSISYQNFEGSPIALHMIDSYNCSFEENTFTDNTNAVSLINSKNNTFSENTFSNTLNLSLTIDATSDHTLFFHNTFLDENMIVTDFSSTTQWYNTTLLEGNHWADYDEPIEGAIDSNDDGLIDTSYNIPGTPTDDAYPLLNPYDTISNLNTSQKYLTIQQAIDDSSIGDYIHVGGGEYHEQITITQSVTLLGDEGETKLDGTGYLNLVLIQSEDVVLQELIIQNTNQTEAIGVDVSSDNVTIRDCIFDKNYIGISCDADNLFLDGGEYYANDHSAVYINHCINTTVSDGYFSSNQRNAIHGFSALNITLTSSSFFNNIEDAVYFDGVLNSSILDCEFSSNDFSGIYLEDSTSVVIENNVFSENFFHGIHFETSENLSIYNNEFLSNQDGIKALSSQHNTMHDNFFSGNQNSIYLSSTTSENTVYYNSFITSLSQHAVDEGSNIWNLSYPLGGNYWGRYLVNDTYRGVHQDENFSDGIYDEPFEIVADGNKDYYPLVQPIGENRPVAVLNLSQTNATVLVNARDSYDRDGVINGYLFNFGDGQSSNEAETTHQYTSNGTFLLRLTVFDDANYVSVITYEIVVTGADSTPPDENSAPLRPPQPDGTISGRFNVMYNYTASTTDPDGDNIYYMFSWGDGTYSDWMGPYESGLAVTATHSFTKGYYSIRVKAKDTLDNESEWSDPLPISMPRGRNLFENFYVFIIELLQRIFPFLFTFN